jgi:hypothetical protein
MLTAERVARLTATAWYPSDAMSFAQWADQGRRFGVMGRSAGWWLGDWLSYGNATYGERYARASRITGYDVQTLMNMVYVASHLDASRRREALSWSHHAEVVGLPEAEQEAWLDRAELERLSVRCLRHEIRNSRRAHAESAASADEPAADSESRAAGRATDADAQYIVCPSCGQEFAPPPSV